MEQRVATEATAPTAAPGPVARYTPASRGDIERGSSWRSVLLVPTGRSFNLSAPARTAFREPPPAPIAPVAVPVEAIPEVVEPVTPEPGPEVSRPAAPEFAPEIPEPAAPEFAPEIPEPEAPEAVTEPVEAPEPAPFSDIPEPEGPANPAEMTEVDEALERVGALLREGDDGASPTSERDVSEEPAEPRPEEAPPEIPEPGEAEPGGASSRTQGVLGLLKRAVGLGGEKKKSGEESTGSEPSGGAVEKETPAPGPFDEAIPDEDGGADVPSESEIEVPKESADPASDSGRAGASQRVASALEELRAEDRKTRARGRELLDRAEGHLQKGEYREARADALEAHRLDPDLESEVEKFLIRLHREETKPEERR